jgi:hypothetical protein
MANKPVKFLSDALFKKNIVKEDSLNNKIFEVSGTLASGAVNIYVPLNTVDTYVSGNLEVSGTVSAKKFNVTEVNTNVIYETSISASINALLDVSASDAANDDYLKYRDGYWVPSPLDLAGGLEAVKNATNRLKYVSTGSFDAGGQAIIPLPLTQLGGDAFPVSSIDYIMYDVSIRENDYWIKDIMHSHLSEISGVLCVRLDAPALNNADQYKVVAVNTNPEDYVI